MSSRTRRSDRYLINSNELIQRLSALDIHPQDRETLLTLVNPVVDEMVAENLIHLRTEREKQNLRPWQIEIMRGEVKCL